MTARALRFPRPPCSAWWSTPTLPQGRECRCQSRGTGTPRAPSSARPSTVRPATILMTPFRMKVQTTIRR